MKRYALVIALAAASVVAPLIILWYFPGEAQAQSTCSPACGPCYQCVFFPAGPGHPVQQYHCLKRNPPPAGCPPL